MANKEWESPLQEEERQSDLPKGEYRFCVKSMIKTVSDGDKTRGAPMAKLELLIYALADAAHEKPIGIAFDRLIRHTSTDWRVCQFFTAIAERKHGEVITPNWDMVVGSVGRAVMFPEKFKETVSMKVDRYLDPAEPEKSVEPKKDAEKFEDFG